MPEFEQRQLAPVLDEAQLIVRGHPASPQTDATRPDEPRRYVQFEIAEVLKGIAPGRDIQIRQPEAAESSGAWRGSDGESRENDVILLLGARDPDDGSYGTVAGFSQGGYVVESDQDGDWVLVNGPAIESGPVSPKDVHRNDVTERIPLDVFRRIAASQMAPQPPAGAAAPKPGPPHPASTLPVLPQPRSTEVAPPPAAAPQDESNRLQPWMAIAAGLGAIAIAVWILLKRASTSGSR